LPWVVGAALLLLAIACVLTLAVGQGDTDTHSTRPPLSPLERKARQMERRLAAMPTDRRLLLATMEAWLEAGHRRLSKIDVEVESVPTAVRDDLEDGLRIWDRYLEQTGDEAGVEVAELAGGSSMELAEIGSRDPARVEADVARAALALRIAGRHRPTLFTLSNTAVFAYFNGETARGEVAAAGAAADPQNSRQLRKIAIEQLNGYQERGETFRRLLEEAKAELHESGDELLERPLKAFVHHAGLNKDDPME